MKKIICIYLFLPIITLEAQKIDASFSEDFSVKMSSVYRGYYGHYRGGTRITDHKAGFMYSYKMGDFFYHLEIDPISLFKVGAHNLSVHKYDAAMKEIKSNKLQDGTTYGPYISKMILFNDKLIVLYFVKIDNNLKLFCGEVDTISLELKNIQELYSKENTDFSQFAYGFSPDNKKMLIAVYGNEKEVYTCIIDDNLAVSGKSNIEFSNKKDLFINDLLLNDQGDKYLSYIYKEKGLYKAGMLIQQHDDKLLSPEIKLTGEELPRDIYFKMSNDMSKIYAYATFGGKRETEGIALITFDGYTEKMISTKTFPYPDDFVSSIYKMDFAIRNRSEYSVRDIKYELNELSNGTLAFTGFPYFESQISSMENQKSRITAGPVVGGFIKGDHAKFSLIPRRHYYGGYSNILTIPYDDKIILLYSDTENNVNIPLDEPSKFNYMNKDAVLATAIMNSDGKVSDRKILINLPKGKEDISLYYTQVINEATVLIPVSTGGLKTEQVKWLQVNIK